MDRRNARKVERQERAREEILDAARQVVIDRGLAGLTLAAVARELELTKAALYYYFPSKAALVFELVYEGLAVHAETVGDAIDATTSGAAGLEALIRASTDHYSARMDELRLAYLAPQVGNAGSPGFTPEMLVRVRPFNDRMYGAVGARIRADQAAGLIAPEIDGRRLAFLAHTSVIGMLTVEGMVEVADQAPLIHSHQAMLDDLVSTFLARLALR